jgi:hypothetical protein
VVLPKVVYPLDVYFSRSRFISREMDRLVFDHVQGLSFLEEETVRQLYGELLESEGGPQCYSEDYLSSS